MKDSRPWVRFIQLEAGREYSFAVSVPSAGRKVPLIAMPRERRSTVGDV